MIFALVDGAKSMATEKGQSAECPGCKSTVRSVIPRDKVAHWRHQKGDCDSWYEPETKWHLSWKQLFAPSECEIPFHDPQTGELHRADVCVQRPDGTNSVVEIQNSPISDEEIESRNKFYGTFGRFYWVVNLHTKDALRHEYFRLSIGTDEQTIQGKPFRKCDWVGRSKTFIERWKNSSEHVYLSLGNHLFYLATSKACAEAVSGLKKGEFLIHELSINDFLESVKR